MPGGSEPPHAYGHSLAEGRQLARRLPITRPVPSPSHGSSGCCQDKQVPQLMMVLQLSAPLAAQIQSECQFWHFSGGRGRPRLVPYRVAYSHYWRPPPVCSCSHRMMSTDSPVSNRPREATVLIPCLLIRTPCSVQTLDLQENGKPKLSIISPNYPCLGGLHADTPLMDWSSTDCSRPCAVING